LLILDLGVDNGYHTEWLRPGASALRIPLPGRHRHPWLRHARPAALAFPSDAIAADGREKRAANWQHRSAEDKPSYRNPERLTLSEKALYDDLCYDHLGRRIRLEQERIAFG
jgi:hypothetical protein